MEQIPLFKPENEFAHQENLRTRSAPVDWLSAEAKLNGQPTFLEFFAGSGLVAEGLRGYFHPAWANDICAKKAVVYEANHGRESFQLRSITDVSGCLLPKAALSWASFPCQDLSLAGLAGGINAARSGLVWEWLRVIDELESRPPVLVAENVLGLVSSAGGSNYKALHEALVARGYFVGAMMIDAERFVPQSRPRVFVVAALAGFTLPHSVVGVGRNWLHPDAVCKAAAGLERWVWWAMPEPPKRQQHLSDILEWDAAFANAAIDARNIGLIAPRHKKYLDLLPSKKAFAAPGYKRTRNGHQVLELRFDNLSGCLRTPRGGSSRQVIVIKKNDEIKSRLLTVREAARLMGAPENYQIPGSYNDGYMAMGDAVAVPVVRWLAEHLLTPLVRAYEHR